MITTNGYDDGNDGELYENMDDNNDNDDDVRFLDDGNENCNVMMIVVYDICVVVYDDAVVI